MPIIIKTIINTTGSIDKNHKEKRTPKQKKNTYGYRWHGVRTTKITNKPTNEQKGALKHTNTSRNTTKNKRKPTQLKLV